MEKTELLACPFCGGDAGEFSLGVTKHSYIKCRVCGAGAPTKRTAVEAVAAWNCRTPSPDNKPLTVEELREMDGEPVWVVSQFLTIPTGWFLLHKNFYGKTIDLYGPIRVICEDELLRCSTPLLIYRRPPEQGE